MKRTFVKTLSKRIIAAAFLTVAIICSAPLESKANTTNIEILSDNSGATVQYTGTVDGALIFSVNIPNAGGDRFALVIEDDNGNTLYEKEYSDKNFSKKFKLVKNDDDSNKSYNFVIKSANKDLEKTFAVSTVQKIIDEVVVTPL